jgi:hypothetical protein
MSKMSGYQKLAELMTKHSEVATFKRFDFLNTLNILYMQAELVHLEEELRDSMREDLESGNSMLSESSNEACTSANVHRGEDTDTANTSNDGQAEATMEMRPLSNLRMGFTTEYSGINERVESGRDWLFLANTNKSSTWGIMLKTRDKLQEYSPAPPKIFSIYLLKLFQMIRYCSIRNLKLSILQIPVTSTS